VLAASARRAPPNAVLVLFQLHFNFVVPNGCYYQFSEDALVALVRLVINSVPAVAGDPVEALRLMPLRRAQGNDDAYSPEHMFIPENGGGMAVSLVEKVEVAYKNAQIRSNELSSSALQRYSGLVTHATPEKPLGVDVTKLPANIYLPTTDDDLETEEPGDTSDALEEYAELLRDDAKESFLVKSCLYGFPFNYCKLLASIHGKKDLRNRILSPGTHIDVNITLKNSFSTCMRHLNPTTAEADRIELMRQRDPRVILEDMRLALDKYDFGLNSEFTKAMEKELKSKGVANHPSTIPSELRTPILARQPQQLWLVNLHLINHPQYGMVWFKENSKADGTRGQPVENNNWKFPPNLEELDICHDNRSILPGGRVLRLSTPNVDDLSKYALFAHQVANFRRNKKMSFAEFYNGCTQFIVVPLTNLYFQDTKWTEHNHLEIRLKFNDALAPEGWTLGFTSVSEATFGCKAEGDLVVQNGMGQTIG